MSSYWALTAQRALSHVVPHGNFTRQRWHCPQMLMFRNIMCLRSHYGIYGRLVHIQISWKFPHLYGKQVAPVVSMYDTRALPVNRKEEWTTGPWKYSLKRQHIFFVVVQPWSRVWLFATPWIAAHQAPLSFTTSQSLLKLISSIELVMLSNHLILCLPLLLLLLIFPRIRVFSNALALGIRWPVCNLKSAFLYIMSFEPHNFTIRQKRQERLSIPISAKRRKSATREVD